MAKARLPSTGISDKVSPSALPLPARSVALPYAPIGPALMALPKAISPMTPVKPITITHIKYDRNWTWLTKDLKNKNNEENDINE